MDVEEAEAVEAVEGEQIALAAATTEEPEPLESGDGSELEVTVRLIDEGALVRWTRPPRDASRCTVRWYEGAPPGERLLATGHTLHDYMLGESMRCAASPDLDTRPDVRIVPQSAARRRARATGRACSARAARGAARRCACRSTRACAAWRWAARRRRCCWRRWRRRCTRPAADCARALRRAPTSACADAGARRRRR